MSSLQTSKEHVMHALLSAPGRACTDVLVVGAGVTGLTLAIELRRRGVDVRVIDRLDAFPSSSRGKGVQPRTLEVFDDLGIVEQVLAGAKTDMRARIYQGARFVAELDLIAPPTADVPYPN